MFRGEQKITTISTYFEQFINSNRLFKNKEKLQTRYEPEELIHRETQNQKISQVLGPILRQEKPSNLFIYGSPGSGKTISIKNTQKTIDKITKERNLKIKTIYINCKLKRVADTEYRLFSQITKEFGLKLPVTGLPTKEIYDAFTTIIDQKEGPDFVLLFLDEIDQLTKKTKDEILYNLTRINEELNNTTLSIVGISNNVCSLDGLDARVKSSLSEEEILFPPYNATQLTNILTKRAEEAFEPETVTKEIITKCAAYSAGEHGDARRAIELLRVAGELAERRNSKQIEEKDVDFAHDKIEKEMILELIENLPKQSKTVLYTLMKINTTKKSTIFTGEIYEKYKNLCYKIDLRPLTQRRISEILSEFDSTGMITAKIISKGRYGRTREISLAIPNNLSFNILEKLSEELSI